MGNPYTSQAISGYNASPPPDDGSQTSANTVRWATHKSKLADPIKTLSEAINSELILAFGKIFGTDHQLKSTNFSIGVGDIGVFFEIDSSGVTATLPAVATAGVGFPVAIFNSTMNAIATIDGNSSETINGATSLVLPPQAWAILTCDGSTWLALASAEYGTFTGTLTGYAAGPTGTIQYTRRGGIITLMAPADILGTSDANTLTMTGLPAAVTPAQEVNVPCVVNDNGSNVLGRAFINNASTTIVFEMPASLLSPTGFTAAGGKGLAEGWQITYAIGA